MPIAVVLASYNHAPWLRACIDSVLAQTRPPDEFIVVDDGSTDGSRPILESYGPALLAVFQANRGTYATLNAGIALSTCEWIALHNSDDVWEPEKLARQEGIAADCPRAGLIHTGVEYIDADGVPYPSPPGADLRGARWPACGEMLPSMLRAMPI